MKRKNNNKFNWCLGS